MLFHNKPKRIYLYGAPVDFRKQINGLAAIVDSEFQGELFAGSWFLFISRDKKKAKVLYWRKSGFALWQLRLERDLFAMGFPRTTDNHSLNWRDFGKLLNGLNVFEGKTHEQVPPKRFS